MPAIVSTSIVEGETSTPLDKARELASRLVEFRRSALTDRSPLILDWYKKPEIKGSFGEGEEEEEEEEVVV
jgi:hypothetical protein